MRIDPMTEREPISQDYEFSAQDVNGLAGTTGLPDEFRRKSLHMYADTHGLEGIIRLFSNFIGLANSVVASNREMIETEAVIRGLVHPEKAFQINLPTIFGALHGALLAVQPTRGMCNGCAFRKGTPANQSPSTTLDAKDCLDGDGGDFMCHEQLDVTGEPKRLCAGAKLAHKHGIGRLAEMERAALVALPCRTSKKRVRT